MRLAPLCSIALIAAVAAACAPSSRREPAPVVYRGTAPAGEQTAPSAQATPPTEVAALETGAPDDRGVVLYDGYETIRARRGDTVQAMAARVGMTGSELAAYNGLSTLYQPGEGDELVLPARPDRYQSRTIAPRPAPEPTQTQVAAAQAPAPTPSAAPATTAQSDIPQDYQPSVQASDAEAVEQRGSGWSAELARAAITGGAAQPTPADSAQAPDPTVTSVAVQEEPLAPTPAPAPEPAPTPQPAPQTAPEPVEPEIASPAPASGVQVAAAPAAQTNVATATNALFIRPTTAPVSRPFSKAPGPNRNDGVDYATAAGDAVAAADSGTVALISKSLGGLGTIVLVRHDNQFLTVYGRVDGVTVKKGDRVARGQVIAQVADLRAPRKPHLHFEVRKGAESVDPEKYY